MLQIIGWLGCVYLVVKALSIAGSSDSYRPDPARPGEEKMRTLAFWACAIAWVAAFVFALWILIQGGAIAEASGLGYSGVPSYSSYSECLADADTADQVSACRAYLD